MNKLAVFAVAMLAAFIGWCGWLSYHYQAGPAAAGRIAGWCPAQREPVPFAVDPAVNLQSNPYLATAIRQADSQLPIQTLKKTTWIPTY